MQNPLASVVGKYQIVDLVGEGAMGTVYRAQDPLLNRTVAIKVMSDAIARDAALRDRFLREAQAAGSLQHPNVVTIYDFGEVDGHLFIAMEYVEGIDLAELIEKQEPMTLEERIGIAIDVLLGLSYAHKRGVVHRDIKPANIRITEEGHAKIMDFGVAHLESSKMTATGMMVGTPNYMAPEQVTGQKVGPATDIFALGAVLYELLAQRQAFAGDSLHNVMFKVVSEDPPPLSSVAPELPRDLERVVRKALAKDAEQRYQSAQEMANDLTVIRASLSPVPGAAALSLGATIARQTAERKAAPSVGARWTTAHLLAVSGVAALALIGVTWTYASRNRDAASGTVPAPAAAAPAASDSAGDAPAVAPRVASGAPESASAPAATGDAPKSRSLPAPDREAELVSAARAAAVRARASAAGAGVAASGLTEGDRELAAADRLARSRRYTEAVAALNRATASWSQAPRPQKSEPSPVVTDRAADNTKLPATNPAAPNSTVTKPPAVNPPASPPVVAPSPVVQPATPRTEATSRPASVEIAALVLEYARAIESRDMSRIKALYPSITSAQQRGFEQFFSSVRGLRASLATSSPSVEGNTAAAQVTGAYEFTDAAGKPQRQPVAFRATFRSDNGHWLIATVR